MDRRQWRTQPVPTSHSLVCDLDVVRVRRDEKREVGVVKNRAEPKEQVCNDHHRSVEAEHIVVKTKDDAKTRDAKA